MAITGIEQHSTTALSDIFNGWILNARGNVDTRPKTILLQEQLFDHNLGSLFLRSIELHETFTLKIEFPFHPFLTSKKNSILQHPMFWKMLIRLLATRCHQWPVCHEDDIFWVTSLVTCEMKEASEAEDLFDTKVSTNLSGNARSWTHAKISR